MLLERDTQDFAQGSIDPARPAASAFEARARHLPLTRRLVQPRQVIVRTGQPVRAVYFVHSGCFRVSVASNDGREKVTGFRLRGELLGLDALGSAVHASDVAALDTGELWEIPLALFRGHGADAEWLRDQLTAAMAGEIRRDWQWMLSTGTLSAEQRVIAFLLDLAERQRALGYSASQLMLRMTRAELGNFLGLQLETVTRALSRLAAEGLIEVCRRDIRLLAVNALAQRLAAAPLAA